MQVDFRILFFLSEYRNGSGLELDKVFRGTLNQDKTQIAFIDLLGKSHIFKVGDDCGIIPDSEINIFPGVKYQIEDVFDHLPEEAKNILNGFDLTDGQDGYDRCRNLNDQLEKFGYYCDYGLAAMPTSIEKIEPS